MKKGWILVLLFILGGCTHISSVTETEENSTNDVSSPFEGNTTTENATNGTVIDCTIFGDCAGVDVEEELEESPAEEETSASSLEIWDGTLGGVEYPYEGKTACGELSNSYSVSFSVPISLVSALQGNSQGITQEDSEGSFEGWALPERGSSLSECEVEGSIISSTFISVNAFIEEGIPRIHLLTRDNGSEFFETSSWRAYNISLLQENGSKQVLMEGSNTYNGMILIPKIIENETISGTWRTASETENAWEPQGTFTLFKQE